MSQDDQKPEKVIGRGRLIELVEIEQPDGRKFEVARRAPGVRLIIADREKRKILLTREHRHELNNWDYRLPGGKVFDLIEEYDAFRATGEDILAAATKKAKEEAREEAGIDVSELQLFEMSVNGATMEWDLYVFEATGWEAHEDGQALEHGEQIEAENWFSYEEAKKMMLDGEMSEHRIAFILLQWLNQQ